MVLRWRTNKQTRELIYLNLFSLIDHRTLHWRRGKTQKVLKGIRKQKQRKMTTEVEKNVIGKFDCYSNPSTLGTRWKRWLKLFELFADAQGLLIASDSDKNKQRRRAQLLHYAGPDVQDIFYTLGNTGEDSNYKAAVDALNAYFIPQVNSTLARHAFRQLKQEENETVAQFVTGLRRYIQPSRIPLNDKVR